MKTSTVLLLGAGVLALLYIGNLGAFANALQCYIASVNFTGITTGRVVLMIQNPSNAAVLLQSMAGTVSANGVVIGNISNFQGGVTIPANQQTPVNINFALSLPAIADTLYTALTKPNGMNNIDFLIQGTANINGGTMIPLNIEQTVAV